MRAQGNSRVKMTETWEALHQHEPVHESHWFSNPSDYWVKKVGEQINISVEAMNIAWGNDNRFWKWVKCGEDETCGFETAAELNQVSWLEVKGSLDLEKHPLPHGKAYELIYHIKFNVDAFGWHDLPVTFAVVTPDGHEKARVEILESHRGRKGWIAIHGGQFEIPAAGKLQFRMKDTTKKWKGGIQIAGVSVRPRCST